MATDVTLPQLGESVTEGTITAWLVEIGDHVEADQPLFELSSDKIDTEVPAPTAGVLKEIKVDVDETVDVGTVVAVIASEDEAEADGQADGGGGGESGGAEASDGGTTREDTGQAEAAEEEAEAEGGDAEAAGTTEDRQEVAREDLGDDEAEDETDQDVARAEREEAEAREEPADTSDRGGEYESREEGDRGRERAGAGGDGSGNGAGEGVLASPIVRRMINEHDLDVSSITPSGQGGRITREDVEAAISGGGAQAQQAPAQEAEAPEQREEPRRERQPSTPSGRQAQPKEEPEPERQVSLEAGPRERVEDLSRVRRRIAAKMMESMQSSAQLTTVQEADVTAIMRLRGRYKDEFRRREGASLSPFVFLCRAAVIVLRRPEHERLNAQADWEDGKVKFHDYVNLGIAVDTERGLLVPNVKNADDLTMPALARNVAELAAKARGQSEGRQGRLEMRDIEGGTFTVTNTGSRGVLIDTPILNYPEVGILGTGAIQKRPVVVEDGLGGESIGVRSMVYLCLTYDHRLVDGADAARFVTDVKHVVETHDWEQELGY